MHMQGSPVFGHTLSVVGGEPALSTYYLAVCRKNALSSRSKVGVTCNVSGVSVRTHVFFKMCYCFFFKLLDMPINSCVVNFSK